MCGIVSKHSNRIQSLPYQTFAIRVSMAKQAIDNAENVEI
jgi:hypothetical protein